MVMLSAKQDGNLTAAATWGVVDPTSLLDNEALSVGVITSYTNSSTFTPGAITIDGLAVKVSSRGSSPSGTFTVALDQSGADVAGTVVTINVADIPYPITNARGWLFLKFAAPVTLLAATAYSVKAKTSIGSQVFLWTASGTNYSRYLRTTTAQAPAAGDSLCVTGDYTGAGAITPRTVTMNDASAGAIVYGQVDVCHYGTLSYGTSAGVNYYLKLAGDLNVWNAGTLNIGTAASPMPATSSAILEFNCSSNVQYGLNEKEGGTVNMRGNAIANVKAKIAANAAAGATSLTTDISTGWKSGDVIALASTTRTVTECESKALSGDAVGTTLPIAALGFAHDGLSPVQAELANLTRNVKVRGISTSLQAYINVAATAVWSTRYVEFYQLGSGTASKRGIDIATTTGSFDFQFCSMHDFVASTSFGINVSGASSNNITVSHNVSFNIASSHIATASTPNTNLTFDDNLGILMVSATSIFSFADVGCTVTNNVAVGAPSTGNCISISEAAAATGTISGNIGHCNVSGACVLLASLTGGTVLNTTGWRGNVGVLVQNCKNTIIDGLTVFGNLTYNYGFNATSSFNITVRNAVADAGVTLTSSVGLRIDISCFDLFFENCSFGASQQHTGIGDINFVTANTFLTATFSNCLFNSPTEVANLSNLLTGSYLRSAKHDQVQDSHKTWAPEGTVQIDTTLGDPATPSSRLTPSSASSKLKSAKKQVPCASGQQVTVSIEVRKSVVGDGTAYNGAQPRLIVEKNVAAGLAVDTVLATASGAAGAWETLTATLPAPTDDCVYTIFVDCDGTQGWVNLDHVRLTNFPANYSGTMKYWRDGLPFNGIDPGGRSGVDFLYWLDGLPSSLLFPFPTAAPAGDTSGEAEGATALAPWKLIAVAGGASDEALGVPTFIPGRLTAAPQSDPSGEAGGQSVFAPGRLSASHSADASSEAPGSPALIAGRSTVIPAGLASDEAFGTPTSDRGLRRIGGLLAKLRSANRRRAVIR
jgi:hypothetical protein